MSQLDLFPTELRLRRIDPAQNMRRFYALSVQPDLFGDWVLVREWGRIGRSSRVKEVIFPNAGLALNALEKIAGQKGRRGYYQEERTQAM